MITGKRVTATFVFCSLLGGSPLWAQDNYIGIVREEKAKLIAAGFAFHVSSGDEGSERGRCDAAQITWRVAKRLADQGIPIGLVAKNPGQKGCTAPDGSRYSHDALVYRGSGACRDILARSETENEPAWNICTEPFMDAGLYRIPFALDPAVEPAPAPTPTPVPQPPPIDVSQLATKEDVAKLEQKIDAVKADTEAVRSGMNKAWKLIGKWGPIVGGLLLGGYYTGDAVDGDK